MPRVKIDYIVSFSSEDPDNPASNLLSWDVNKKKWLCKKGEPSCSVVLQLNKAVKICSVIIGAHHAALVEVLVGRSETPNEPFQVLVPSSVFQSPSEARRAAPADCDKVRSFGREALADTRAQRWDRLRIVCTQPYNKHISFGLSFVHVHSEDESPPAAASAPAPAPAPAPPDLHSSDEDDFRPGELFAKHLQKPLDTGAQIRQATSHALRNIPDSSIKLNKTPIAKPQPPSRPAGGGLGGGPARDREAGLLYTTDDDRHNDKVDGVVNRHNEKKKDEQTNKQEDKRNKDDRKDDKCASASNTQDRRSSSRLEPNERTSKNVKDESVSKNDNGNKNDPSRNGNKNDGHSSKKKDDDTFSRNGKKDDGSRKRRHSDKKDVNSDAPLSAGPVSAAPHALLAGVVFVLSGYEHPRRGALRTAALALGADCRRDWGPDCTHLICAFPNTPKLRAVRAGPHGARAVVVRGEWVEETARTRRALPWQWFATEERRRVSPPPGWDAPRPPDQSSECDTDDEIERVRQKMKKRRAASPAACPAASPAACPAASPAACPAPPQGRAQSDSCGGSTDEESAPPSPSHGGEARLPALFAGLVFAVRARGERGARLRRYLRAYGGLVAEEADGAVDYVVCDSEEEETGGEGVVVRGAWVWRCHVARRLLPHDAYLRA